MKTEKERAVHEQERIIWCLRWFFSTVVGNLGRCRSHKKNLKSVVEENTALRLENDKLRERLNEEEETAPTKTKHVRENVSRIYDDGFHVCRDFYGQRRELDAECMFCDELLF